MFRLSIYSKGNRVLSLITIHVSVHLLGSVSSVIVLMNKEAISNNFCMLKLELFSVITHGLTIMTMCASQAYEATNTRK